MTRIWQIFVKRISKLSLIYTGKIQISKKIPNEMVDVNFCIFVTPISLP